MAAGGVSVFAIGRDLQRDMGPGGSRGVQCAAMPSQNVRALLMVPRRKSYLCESARLLKERTRQQLCHFTTHPPASFQGIT